MRGILVGGSACAGLSLAVTGMLAHGEAVSQGRGDRAASLAAWERVATVLQHPRCLNCHQPDEVKRGDDRRPHAPRVVRGRDNAGAPGMRCSGCHSAQWNNAASGVPGAAEWKMPPRSMTWGGRSLGEICRSLKNPARNGGRSHKAIVKHMQEDSLVHWSWEPGGKREAVPMPHEVFVEFVAEWLRTGAHCPS